MTAVSDPDPRAPNMHDVAARAGVSHQTVSRVLNGFEGIKPATKARVEDAIRDLGYRRNLAARTLATRRTRTIGVLVPATADFGPTRSLLALERATRDAGYRSLVTSTTLDTDAVRESLGFLLDQGIEALVVIAPYDVVLAEVARLDARIPTVELQSGEHAASGSVTVDQAAGARLAVRHLLALGHRRIQQITGPPEFLEAGVRRDAVEAELRAAGVDGLPVLQGDWTADSGYARGAELDPATTAVVCGNDQMALGLVHALADLGRRVPDDVSVVGFDDIPEAAHSLPPLTTVHQDFDAVGALAVEALLGALDGSEDLAPRRVEPWLVERRSTARV